MFDRLLYWPHIAWHVAIITNSKPNPHTYKLSPAFAEFSSQLEDKI